MDKLLDNTEKALKHLRALHDVFNNPVNYSRDEMLDYEIYKSNYESLNSDIEELELTAQLYTEKGRQMILADMFEYILIGRGYYSLKPNAQEDRGKFIKLILHFVNLLMSYEMMTVSTNMRQKFLQNLGDRIPQTTSETRFNELYNFTGKVGLPKKDIPETPKKLNKYFDSILPKTAGGLWHELLVYAFFLRNNIGYIMPLVLVQRLLSKYSSIIPPDFLIITPDKNMYGIEVGTKKEIQSGSFSLQTNIPTATIDTENSRTSDRCPICKRWIPFCDYVIRNYSNLDIKLGRKNEIRCLNECDLDKESIAKGECKYTKYSRKRLSTRSYTQHALATGLHYHYGCVLKNVTPEQKELLINANDVLALKTHYPYYSGLEMLIGGEEISANNQLDVAEVEEENVEKEDIQSD